MEADDYFNHFKKGYVKRGIFQNKDRMITSLISREEFYALQSEKFVNDTF